MRPEEHADDVEAHLLVHLDLVVVPGRARAVALFRRRLVYVAWKITDERYEVASEWLCRPSGTAARRR